MFGADAVGLVGKMPGGPGVIDDGSIARISRTVPPPVATFLLTSETSARAIVDHWKRVLTNTIQIVDYIEDGEYAKIRGEIPWVKLVQVVHVQGPDAVGVAQQVSRHVDAILLDSGKPDAENKELGGTGRTHDWSVSREIVRSVNLPVFLAGGITPENVEEAVETVQPYGVDVCTGVRTAGKLDADKLERFFAGMKRAAAGTR